MPATVIQIDSFFGANPATRRRASWSLLEVARPGARPVPVGILLATEEDGQFAVRLRDLSLFDEAAFEDLEEDELDFLAYLADDLVQKGRETGGLRLMKSLEDSLSHFLRISDRNSIAIAGSAQAAADRLFEEHVDSTVREYVSHLPFYGLRAAATKFGEGMEAVQESWVRVPGGLKLTPAMFVAQVVGRSMEPLIPNGSLCIFRAGVTGSRQGRLVLIDKFDETDFSSRFTVKRYTSRKIVDPATGEWRHEQIRLEPLNREFEAFDLEGDRFNVIAEFVQVLPS
jgi:SOS-response transcriptional repressor LexA